jgi:HK97 family phage prohead protease
MSGTVFKTSELKAVADGQYEFVASDESIDRMGDVIRINGWELANYKRNPIVLFQHQSSNPVGISTKVWVEGKALMSRIKLAAEGTSPFIDTLRKLMAQGIVKAVSVGFVPTKEPSYIRDVKNDQITGLEYIGQELLEISLVSVPANPQALSLAKSLHVPESHLSRVFAPQAKDAFVHMAQQRMMLDIIKSRRSPFTRG